MSAIPKPPLLHPGDRLTPAEFLRRYERMPDLKKAELIEGVVYMPSPVNDEDHGTPHFHMISWLGFYRALTFGVEGGDNSTLKLKIGFNVPQPDAFLRILHELGGQCHIDAEGYVVGAPEWIGEVAATSASYDLHDKLRAYERNGVQEYVVWRVFDRQIDWFILRQQKLKALGAARDGYYKSRVFPGLWLDPKALIASDLAQVLKVVHKGVATPEHKRFVQKLAKRKTEHSGK